MLVSSASLGPIPAPTEPAENSASDIAAIVRIVLGMAFYLCFGLPAFTDATQMRAALLKLLVRCKGAAGKPLRKVLKSKARCPSSLLVRCPARFFCWPPLQPFDCRA